MSLPPPLRKGDSIVEEHLVGNALHVYGMFRRCLHFVDKAILFLEEKIKPQKEKESAEKQGELTEGINWHLLTFDEFIYSYVDCLEDGDLNLGEGVYVPVYYARRVKQCVPGQTTESLFFFSTPHRCLQQEFKERRYSATTKTNILCI